MTEEELEKKASEYANEWKQYAIDNYRWDKNIIEECTEQRIIGYKDGYEQGQEHGLLMHLNVIADDYKKENEELKKSIAEKNLEVEKMKCCGNCKFHKYWGNELHCTHDGECIRFVNYAENRQDSWELED